MEVTKRSYPGRCSNVWKVGLDFGFAYGMHQKHTQTIEIIICDKLSFFVNDN